MPYSSLFEPNPTIPGVSHVQTSTATELQTSQRFIKTEETATWSPCYICFRGNKAQSFSSLVVVQLLMHEIWMWENEMADSDQAAVESEAGPRSRYELPERVPLEKELLPCHYFDFFYGASHGGVVATLLGRLRLRVRDATERFLKINQACCRRRGLFNKALPLRNILRIDRYTKSLESAVYGTATKHPLNPAGWSGIDQPFRDSASVSAISPLFKPDDPREAQTCVVVPVLIDGAVHPNTHIHRTFRCGDEYPIAFDMPFANRPNLTICQILRAAMGAALEVERRFETAPILNAAITGSYYNVSAGQDYERFYLTSASSGTRSPPTTAPGPPAYTNRPMIGGPALFLSMLWRGVNSEDVITVVDKPEASVSRRRGSTASKAHTRRNATGRMIEQSIFPFILSSGKTHSDDSLRLPLRETTYV
jgi:hypothetical protein